MKGFKLYTVALLVTALLVLAGCENSLSPTTPSNSEVEEVQEAVNQADGVSIGATINTDIYIVTGAGLTAGTTDAQRIDVIFDDERIDEDTISAISFYTLEATARADGAYDRRAELTATNVDFSIQGGLTVLEYTFDMGTASEISDTLEMEIDAGVLTAAGGTKALDLDGDGVQGESPDDNFYNYSITVAGAGITVPAAANERNPRATFGFTGETLSAAAVDDTTFTLTMVSDNVTAAILNGGTQLQKYDTAGASWSDVSFTSSLDTNADTFTVTIPAIADGDVYRINYVDPYEIQENATTNGFARRFNNNQELSVVEDAYGPFTFRDATASSYLAPAATIDEDSFVAFDGTGKNGFVQIDLDETAIGTEGLVASTVTTDSVKLYNTATQEYVPWDSVEIITSDLNQTGYKNDVMRFTLDPNYSNSGNTNNLEVHIGPTVKALGDTTATTDDIFIGDISNVDTTFPYGQFRVIEEATIGQDI